MKCRYLWICVLWCVAAFAALAQEHPKREFRGAWLSTAWQQQFVERSAESNKQALMELLDGLQQVGINAVVFQVRPQADAFYASEIEPWSRHLTGEAGVAPAPYWDPLQFMIEQCHERNIELHAWLNPYRVTLSTGEQLPEGHIYHRQPELFLTYGGKIYFDPGLPESRKHILRVVKDIISRYDVDAIHMDDYFYPYPVNGEEFPDNRSYTRYGKGMNRDDWRRNNVNMLIEEIDQAIEKSKKPWIQFGISPFGIYRNKSSWAKGSDTNGLQNYDDLYADVLLWAQRGWIDYLVPQLYWTFENERACYNTLVRWWNGCDLGDCLLYIGQDVARSYDADDLAPNTRQLGRKIELSRYLDNIEGDCYWYGYQLLGDYRRAALQLSRDFYAKPALLPVHPQAPKKLPDEVVSVKVKETSYGRMLEWKPRHTREGKRQQVAFAIYRFGADTPVDLTDTDALVKITRNTAYLLPEEEGKPRYTYVVTAIDRFHNESREGKSVKVTL